VAWILFFAFLAVVILALGWLWYSGDQLGNHEGIWICGCQITSSSSLVEGHNPGRDAEKTEELLARASLPLFFCLSAPGSGANASFRRRRVGRHHLFGN
jgi:hypothetical protein